MAVTPELESGDEIWGQGSVTFLTVTARGER
jgi:hypothetical protein